MVLTSTYEVQEEYTSLSQSKSGLEEYHERSERANPPVNLTEYRLFHQVLRHRAADPCQVPLVAFPKTGNADFEYFTAVDLYRFANCAASLYEERGLRAVSGMKPFFNVRSVLNNIHPAHAREIWG